MPLDDREEDILKLLSYNESTSIKELSKKLFISEPTVRRDLTSMEQKGKVIRTHGGVILKPPALDENLPLYIREKEHNDEKILIAKKAVSLIKDGNLIMLDSSTSSLSIIPHLKDFKEIIVVTNSAKASVMLGELKIKNYCTGGQLINNSLAFVGSHAEKYLKSFNADICFISVRTLTNEGMLTDNAVEENNIRKVMLSVSGKKVLLLDTQKIGAPCIHNLCTVDDITDIVSEKKFPKTVYTGKANLW